MGEITKRITVTAKQEAWIRAQLEAGAYGSESEVVQHAIDALQAQGEEAEKVRAALLQGENSGVSDRSPREIRRAVIADLKRDGVL